MPFFRRKSKWDRIRDTLAATIGSGNVRRATKVAAGVIGRAAAVTAASAAVSSARHQEDDES
jgi:hypothetical protein